MGTERAQSLGKFTVTKSVIAGRVTRIVIYRRLAKTLRLNCPGRIAALTATGAFEVM